MQDASISATIRHLNGLRSPRPKNSGLHRSGLSNVRRRHSYQRRAPDHLASSLRAAYGTSRRTSRSGRRLCPSPPPPTLRFATQRGSQGSPGSSCSGLHLRMSRLLDPETHCASGARQRNLVRIQANPSKPSGQSLGLLQLRPFSILTRELCRTDTNAQAIGQELPRRITVPSKQNSEPTDLNKPFSRSRCKERPSELEAAKLRTYPKLGRAALPEAQTMDLGGEWRVRTLAKDLLPAVALKTGRLQQILNLEISTACRKILFYLHRVGRFHRFRFFESLSLQASTFGNGIDKTTKFVALVDRMAS